MELIIILVVGIVLGMYIASQIKSHIYGEKQNQKLKRNMDEFFLKDNIDKTENITHYYTHIKKEDVN